MISINKLPALDTSAAVKPSLLARLREWAKAERARWMASGDDGDNWGMP